MRKVLFWPFLSDLEERWTKWGSRFWRFKDWETSSSFPLSRNREKNIIVVSNFVRSIFRSFQKEILSLFEFHFQWREMGTNIQTYLPTYVRTYLIVTSKFGCYVWGKAWSRWPYVGYSIDQPNTTNISTSCPLSHIKILSFYYNK